MKFLFGISLLLFSTYSFGEGGTAVELALNWKPEPEFGGFYQAVLQKLDEQNQLKLTILPGGAGQPVAQMVAAKKVKFGISSAEEVILARENGAKIVAIFAVYQNDPQGFMVHEDRKIERLQDLFQSEGTVALQKGLPFTEFLLKKYAPIKAKIVPYTGGITQFLQEKSFSQQCFITSEPIAAKRAGKKTKTLLVSNSGYNPYLAVVVVHEDTIKNEVELVKNFSKMSETAWAGYLKNPKDTNVFMHKLNPSLSLPDFDESSKVQIPFIETLETKKHGLGTMNTERWATLQNQLRDLKLIKKNSNPDSFFKLLR